MTTRWVAVVALVLLSAATPAQVPPSATAGMAVPVLVGSGKVTYLWFEVYDVELWREDEPTADLYDSPFVLRLGYLMDIKATQLGATTLTELRRQAGFQATAGMRERFVALFPDVVTGDTIAARWDPGGGVRFSHNGAPYSVLDDPGLGRRFLDIWLGPATSDPATRAALLGTVAKE